MSGLRQVHPREAIQIWDVFEKRIDRVIARNPIGSTAEDILTCVQNGTMQLWLTASGKGVGVTQVISYPQYRVLLIFIVAGEDVQEWLDAGHHQLDSFAQSQGCAHVDFIGRKGWAKLVADMGYNQEWLMMRRNVGECSVAAGKSKIHTPKAHASGTPTS